jgi:hypothetical protein
VLIAEGPPVTTHVVGLPQTTLAVGEHPASQLLSRDATTSSFPLATILQQVDQPVCEWDCALQHACLSRRSYELSPCSRSSWIRATCRNDSSQVIPLNLVEHLAYGIEVGVRVNTQGDVEVGMPGDPLGDVRRGLELEQQTHHGMTEIMEPYSGNQHADECPRSAGWARRLP